MRKKIVKTYFSIKGFFIVLLVLKNGSTYKAMSLEPRKGYSVNYYYRGNRTFCYITRSTGIGIEYTDTKIKKYKYWEIGILNFKLI